MMGAIRPIFADDVGHYSDDQSAVGLSLDDRCGLCLGGNQPRALLFDDKFPDYATLCGVVAGFFYCRCMPWLGRMAHTGGAAHAPQRSARLCADRRLGDRDLHSLFVTSVALNGAALAIVLIYLYPAFVTLGARIFFQEAIGLRQLAALILAIFGCALLVRVYDPAVLALSWLGVLIGIGSALTHASYVLYNQRQAATHSPFVALALTMGFGTLTLVIINLVLGGPSQIVNIGEGAAPWLILIALALGPTMIGYLMFTAGLRHIPGRIASIVVMIEAPIATTAAVLLLGERLEWPQVLGMILILGGALLPSLPLRRRAAIAASAAD
jgi:drug/metabolite transporter (DMT)-like permease